MKSLARRIEALEALAEERARRLVVVHELPDGEAHEPLEVEADGPPIEWQDCRSAEGEGVWWLILRRPSGGLTAEQVAVLHEVESDPATTVISRLRF